MFNSLTDRKRLAIWLGIIVTAVLVFQIWLFIENFWYTLDFGGRVLFLGGTVVFYIFLGMAGTLLGTTRKRKR